MRSRWKKEMRHLSVHHGGDARSSTGGRGDGWVGFRRAGVSGGAASESSELQGSGGRSFTTSLLRCVASTSGGLFEGGGAPRWDGAGAAAVSRSVEVVAAKGEGSCSICSAHFSKVAPSRARRSARRRPVHASCFLCSDTPVITFTVVWPAAATVAEAVEGGWTDRVSIWSATVSILLTPRGVNMMCLDMQSNVLKDF